MRKSLLLSLLTSLVLSSLGCVVIVKEEERLPPGPVEGHVECPVNPHEIEEIDAVASLSFDPARRDAYVRIAKRRCLSNEAQVHLVNQAFARLSFENMIEEVLVALIHSPSFTCDARSAILTQIKRLTFDNTRSRILRELDKRGSCLN